MKWSVLIEGLVKRYGRVEALRGVSFTLPRRGISVILGPNGAGKTTTLRAICGALRVDRGRVEVLGHDVLSDPMEVRSIVGVVPELPYLFPGLSVERNLRLAGRLHGLSGGMLEDAVRRVVELMDLRGMLNRKYGALSKGFKRRVDIAAALIHDPQLLVLDEPTGGLDLMAASRLRERIMDLASEGTSIVMSTHNVSEAASLAGHVVVLVEGRVGFSGSPDKLREFVGGGLEFVIMVDGDAGVLASHIGYGGIMVEGRILRIRARDPLEALRRLIKAVEEAGVGVRSLSIHEPSWEEVFMKLFRGEVISGDRARRGCGCEGA